MSFAEIGNKTQVGALRWWNAKYNFAGVVFTIQLLHHGVVALVRFTTMISQENP